MLNPFTRRGSTHALVVGMTGVKLGERFAQIGCAHGGRLGAVAAKVGLSGRAIAVVPDDAAATRARKGAADAGVLVEVELAPPTRLPLDDGSFDLVLIDDTDGFFASMREEERTASVRETLRILRGGGRTMIVGRTPATGIAALFSTGTGGRRFDGVAALEAGGFRSVRTLAERDGLIFVEGIKPREISPTCPTCP